MKILSINQQTQIYPGNNRRTNFRAGLPQDVVNISKKEFLNLPPNELWTIIKKSKQNIKNLLGKGGTAEVWRIEGTDYCIRIPFTYIEMFRTKPNFNLTEQDKINHTIAKFPQGVTIMPILKGVTFDTEGTDNKDIIKILKSMPQKAYDNLFLQVYNADRLGMKFDCGNKNIIVNPEEKTLTAIDFYKYQKWSVKNNILSSLYNSLTSASGINDKQKKYVAAKLLKAALNALIANPKDIDFERCGFSRFINEIIENRTQAAILKYHLKELSCTQDEEFKQHLDSIKTTILELSLGLV